MPPDLPEPSFLPVTLADEQRILERARNDPAQFGPLYDAFYPLIFGYVYRRTGDYHRARDISADTFLKAVLKLPGFEWRGVSVAAWLLRIATNELRMFYRRRTYESAVFGQLPEPYIQERQLQQIFEQEQAELERQRAQYQDFARAQAVLQRLPVKYQEVIALRYFEQKSVLEIAEILQKSDGTVKSLLSRGVAKMAALLGGG